MKWLPMALSSTIDMKYVTESAPREYGIQLSDNADYTPVIWTDLCSEKTAFQ